MDSVYYLVDMAAYDGRRSFLSQENPVRASLDYFGQIMRHSKFNADTTIIILLTNMDDFRAKIKARPLADYFPTYTGGDSSDLATDCVVSLFRAEVKDDSRWIFERQEIELTPKFNFASTIGLTMGGVYHKALHQSGFV